MRTPRRPEPPRRPSRHPECRLRTDGGRPGDDPGERPPTDADSASRAAATHAEAVADALAGYDRAVEVGIGRRTDVAARLHGRGTTVVAVDRRPVTTPDGVPFLRDDVTDPRPREYPDADVVYALNLPPELHAPVSDLARDLEADLAFTTLGGDPATVAAEPESVAGGTLYWVRGRRRD